MMGAVECCSKSGSGFLGGDRAAYNTAACLGGEGAVVSWLCYSKRLARAGGDRDAVNVERLGVGLCKRAPSVIFCSARPLFGPSPAPPTRLSVLSEASKTVSISIETLHARDHLRKSAC